MHALVLAATIMAFHVPSPSHDCRSPQAAPTASKAAVLPRKLGDLPDANEVLAVQRRIGGCDYLQVTRANVSVRDAVELRGMHVPGLRGVLVPSGGGAWVETLKLTTS